MAFCLHLRHFPDTRVDTSTQACRASCRVDTRYSGGSRVSEQHSIRLLSLKSTRSTKLRFSQSEAPLPFPKPKHICRCTSKSNSNSNSEASSVRYGTKRAFISVSNKIDLAFLGKGLHDLGFTLVSTGGTALCLEENGVPVMRVEHLTGFPELFNGPKKTMHSSSMGAASDRPDHMESLRNFRIIGAFDVVVANFNPYYTKISLPGGVQHEEEGPELIHTLGSYLLTRLAENHEKVLVVVDPQDYRSLLEFLKREQDDHQFRHELGKKAIEHEIMCSHAEFLDRSVKDIKDRRNAASSTPIKPKTAFLNVCCKRSLEFIGETLSKLGYALFSCGESAEVLKDHGISVIVVNEFYYPVSPLEGVDLKSYLNDLGFGAFNVVIINIFDQYQLSTPLKVDNIGMVMIDLAIENRAVVVVDPADYGRVTNYMDFGGLPEEIQKYLEDRAKWHTEEYRKFVMG